MSCANTSTLSLSHLQVEFPPDLCSRVTFVNFTVTRGSLQSQCLNQVLKAERPDVDAKRSDLLKLQGTVLLCVYCTVSAHWAICTSACVNMLSRCVCVCVCVCCVCAGEFHLRLRHLEQSLLQALNEVKGRILDDDR